MKKQKKQETKKPQTKNPEVRKFLIVYKCQNNDWEPTNGFPNMKIKIQFILKYNLNQV